MPPVTSATPDISYTLLIVGIVVGAITALVPVFLALIAAYLKLVDIYEENKEQTQKLDDAAIEREKLAAKIIIESVKVSAVKEEPQHVIVKNVDPVPVDIKDDATGK